MEVNLYREMRNFQHFKILYNKIDYSASRQVYYTIGDHGDDISSMAIIQIRCLRPRNEMEKFKNRISLPFPPPAIFPPPVLKFNWQKPSADLINAHAAAGEGCSVLQKDQSLHSIQINPLQLGGGGGGSMKGMLACSETV